VLLLVLGTLAVAIVLLAPRIIRPGLRLMPPIVRMKKSPTQLEPLEAQSGRKRPETRR
jgi:hypothetical protein